MTARSNTFAERSNEYAQSRPRYPRIFFEWLAKKSAGHTSAWDCATGNGQAAVDLASYFDVVQATDLSAEQVAEGIPSHKVIYSTCPAEHTHFDAGSFDLITVAQALHWFDYERFWTEVERVAKPGALFCAWGYAWFHCRQDVLDELVTPLRTLLEPFWAPNNRILWDGYRNEDIRLPFRRLDAPPFSIEAEWNIAQLIAYLSTWSAYKRALANREVSRNIGSLCEAASLRFSGHGTMLISMPLAVVAAQVTPRTHAAFTSSGRDP